MITFLVVCISEVIEVSLKIGLKVGQPVEVRNHLLMEIEILQY